MPASPQLPPPAAAAVAAAVAVGADSTSVCCAVALSIPTCCQETHMHSSHSRRVSKQHAADKCSERISSGLATSESVCSRLFYALASGSKLHKRTLLKVSATV